MRIVVHGQQAFGKAVLEKLLERGEDVVAVCTAPTKEGRPEDPLAELARQQEIPLHQPANTMATVSEAIGLALPYSAGAPAPYEIRDRFCMAAGEKVMELVAKNIRPRDIVTRKALENAATVVAASGGSTNAALHLPAIAHECGIEFDLFDVAEIFKRTPYIADMKPGGRYVAKDMFEAGGVPLLMKTLLDNGFLHGDCLTVTGRSIAENLKNVKWNPDQDVIRPAETPLSPTGGVVGLKGNLAPEGAIVKVADLKTLKFSGPARCFDSEEECFEAVSRRDYSEGDVIVIFVFLIVVLLWIPFRAENVNHLMTLTKSLFDFQAYTFSNIHQIITDFSPFRFTLIFLIFIIFMRLEWSMKEKDFSSWISAKSRFTRISMYYFLITLILLAGNFSVKPNFIYFQF
jgi:hypothetical protein